jgi:hypothetical protein
MNRETSQKKNRKQKKETTIRENGVPRQQTGAHFKAKRSLNHNQRIRSGQQPQTGRRRGPQLRGGGRRHPVAPQVHPESPRAPPAGPALAWAADTAADAGGGGGAEPAGNGDEYGAAGWEDE